MSVPPNTTLSPARMWGILALLTLLNVLNIMDRQLLPTLGPLIKADLQISLTTFGLIVGPVFVALYSVFALIFGRLADRLHRPRLIAFGLTIWSGLTAATGLAATIWHVAAARLLVGVGESALAPAAVSMLGDIFPERRRGLATGIYYMGIPLGFGAAAAAGALIGATYGWRACFLVLGVLGLLIVPLLLFINNPKRQQARSADTAVETKPSVRDMLRAVVSVPSLALVFLFGVLTDFALTSLNLVNFLLVQERGISFAQATIQIGVIFVVGGVVGNVLGGWLGDWAEARGKGGRFLFLALTQIIGLPFTLAFLLLPMSTPTALITSCGIVMSTSSMMKYGPMLSAIQALTPVHLRATGIAVFLVTIGLLGNGMGPLVAGFLGDRIGIQTSLVICSLIGALSAIPALIGWRRYGEDLESAARRGA
jgi:MFS transporter, Spinster family, sphingosine-1-phosphate transporter